MKVPPDKVKDINTPGSVCRENDAIEHNREDEGGGKLFYKLLSLSSFHTKDQHKNGVIGFYAKKNLPDTSRISISKAQNWP